jgi:hypothetical protein
LPAKIRISPMKGFMFASRVRYGTRWLTTAVYRGPSSSLPAGATSSGNSPSRSCRKL